MDELIISLENTIRGLQEKKLFLEEQKIHYSQIKDSLLSYDRNSFSDETIEGGGEGQRGQVFGEIIISSKIYVNLGYEYFVEKSQQQAIDVVFEKISLINDAITQFETKLREAAKTLSDLEKVQQIDSGDTTVENGEPTLEENFSFMDIREELDEDGSVISSSVKPTAKSFDTLMKNSAITDSHGGQDVAKGVGLPENFTSTPSSSVSAEKQSSSKTHDKQYKFGAHFEEKVRNKLNDDRKKTVLPDVNVKANKDKTCNTIQEISRTALSHADQPTIKEVNIEDVHIQQTPNSYIKSFDPSKPAIKPEDVYSFEDIVQQLERQDELEDGTIDQDDIKYDLESYEDNYEAYGESVDDDSDEDDYDYEFSPSIVPASAQNIFMGQINRLREEKVRMAEKDKKQSTKSIMKKESSGKDKSSKKKVGFAPELEVCEIENFKDETKKNTFNGFQSMIQSPVYSNSGEDEDFDYDLFAKMLGIKDSDALHEKYENEVDQEPPRPVPSEGKKRVSRFKKDRTIKQSDIHSNMNTTLNEVEPAADGSFSSNMVNDPAHNKYGESTVSDIVEHDTVVIKNVDCPHISEAVERAPKNKDTISEKNPQVVSSETNNSNSGHEHSNLPVGSAAIIGRIHSDETATDVKHVKSGNKKNNDFKKNLGSLQKPRNRNSRHVARSLDFSNIEENGEEDLIKEEETTRSEEKEAGNTQGGSVSDHFPAEISAIIDDKKYDIVTNPKVDFRRLGESNDDMAKAYLLGMYNDDVDDPGTVVEKLDDLQNYNEQAQGLENEIKEFIGSNPPNLSTEGVDDMESYEEGPMMVDVMEKDVPTSQESTDYDIGLEIGTLQDEVAIEYHRMRHKLISTQDVAQKSVEELQLEPIDEHGNPIKVSRFKSSKLNMGPRN